MTREEAIGVLKANYPDSCFELLRDAVDIAIKALQEPEQKKGKWIESARRIGTKFHPDCPDFYSVFVCTSCLKANDRTEKYCPNCGAKMEE